MIDLLRLNRFAEDVSKINVLQSRRHGLIPVIDWDRLSAAVEEMDDLDYVRRFF